MVRYLNGGLQTEMEKACHGPKCPVFKWTAKSRDFTTWKLDTHSSIQMVTVFLVVVGLRIDRSSYLLLTLVLRVRESRNDGDAFLRGRPGRVLSRDFVLNFRSRASIGLNNRLRQLKFGMRRLKPVKSSQNFGSGWTRWVEHDCNDTDVVGSKTAHVPTLNWKVHQLLRGIDPENKKLTEI